MSTRGAGVRQEEHDVRFEWGPTGARSVGEGADVVVVVDVLSFCTTLSIAAERGTVVLPYRWDDADDAATYAAQNRAVLAVGREVAGPGEVSLSPASLRAAGPIERLVLPSPNGATLSVDLAATATSVVGACLRNAKAVADWIAREHDEDSTIVVAAAGERWADGSLRPAVEDLWGAGAVLSALEDHDWPGLSPEAAMAADAYRLVAGREASHLRACASGLELIERGFGGDVDIAAEVGSTTAVPLLSDRGYVAAP